MKKIITSKAGIILDSSVHTGGGTDMTARLQEILNTAASEGGVHLVMDGAALISGLTVYSNTTIECLNRDCGFFLKDRANASLITNAHPSRETIHDRNISLLGGTYNHNCLNQAHHIPEDVHYSEAEHFVVGIGLYGVENLLIRDFTIRDHRTFAFLITNWKNVTMENIDIELPNYIHNGNQDGIHIQGPGQFLTLRNIRGRTGDDFIALNGDEESGDGRPWFHPCATVGAMSDILIDTVMVDDAVQVIRILSRNHEQDRITIRNVSGFYRSFGFCLTAWDYKYHGLPGAFGSIFIENVDLRQTENLHDYTAPYLFRLSGKHKCMQLKNIRCFDPTDSRSLVHIEGDTDVPDMGSTPGEVECLIIEGLHVQDNAGSSCQNVPYILVEGHVKRFIMRSSQIIAAKQDNPVPVISVKGRHGRVDSLMLSQIYTENTGEIIENKDNKIQVVQMNDILIR